MLRELREVFGIDVVNSWGLTEFPIASCPSPADPLEKLERTVGRPSPDVEVRVVDGELRLKGPQCFLGYVDASLDADAFDDEGWLRTGDLGELDPEGYVAVTGRLKDVIIRNGENISALELEDVLLRHPDIVDVTVLGLPDARTGERVCAVVVPAPGRTVDLDTIAGHCGAEGIARQKTPEQLEIVDQIDRNPMGKVVKAHLREQIQSRGRRRRPARALVSPPVLGFVAPTDGAMVRRLEEAGVRSFWVGGHVASVNPSPEPVVWLARLVEQAPAATVGTATLVLPLYPPALLAKQVADLDNASGGRVVLGIGVGGEYESDFAAVGVPRSQRGSRGRTRASTCCAAFGRGSRWSTTGATSLSTASGSTPLRPIPAVHRSWSAGGARRRSAGPRCWGTDGCPISTPRHAMARPCDG